MAHVSGSRHLYRISVPSTWPIPRKGSKFVVKPSPGTYNINLGMPIALWLRDYLNIAKNIREVKYLLMNKKVLVNYKHVKDYSFQVGLFDVISLPEINKHFRVLMKEGEKLYLKEISEEESKYTIIRIVRKTMVKGGKIQVTGLNGWNFLFDKNEINTGDSILYNLKEKKIEKILKMDVDSLIYFYYGKKSGKIGKLKQVKILRLPYGNTRLVEFEDLETGEKKEGLWEYCVVIGKEKPLITVK